MADYFASCSGGMPEAPLIDWALRRAPQSGTFIDVGAHVGTWAITAGLYGYDVLAFEASPTNAQLCSEGITESSLSGYASCHPLALSGYRGRARLTAPYADGGGGSIELTFENPAIDQTVLVSRLDDQWSDLDSHPSWIKIDVEGSELGVLEGGVNLIRRYAPWIMFECWADERGQRREDLFRYLNDTLDYGVTPTTWPEMYVAEPRG